jgi:RNA polymerase sigma-70 factor (ECF subfamily)
LASAEEMRRFEDVVLVHLDAAYNLARWLTRDAQDAKDVVQDACVRALRYFSSLRDHDARAWFFAIVRNTWYSRVARDAKVTSMAPLDNTGESTADGALDPEARLLQQTAVARVRDALDQLPIDSREVLVLREIEGLSYKDIASVVQVPIGTVMSRISRGRRMLFERLNKKPDDARRPQGLRLLTEDGEGTHGS